MTAIISRNASLYITALLNECVRVFVCAATSYRQMAAEAGSGRQEAASHSDTSIRPWLSESGQVESPGCEQRDKTMATTFLKHTQNK